MFKPKIFTAFNDYTKEQFLKDIMAGAIVTVLAIPLSIAFSIAMGVPPQMGLYVSIIGSFFIALLGGTYTQVAGPSAVYIVAINAIYQSHGFQGIIISTFLAGIILILLGIFRLGAIIKYLPYPIMIGFMSGIALVIFTQQIRGFLGLDIGPSPANFAARWLFYLRNLGRSDVLTVLIGALGLGIMIFWPRVTKKIPGGLVALIATTGLVAIFNLPVQTIGTQFDDLTLTLPTLAFPTFQWADTLSYLDSAFTLAFLCVITSLLTAVAADNLTDKKHDSNTELIAQGISNVFLGFCGYIPSAGVTTRTMANVASGARTPMSTFIHSILLALAVFFLMPLMSLIPMVTLASMLIMASYGMSEWRMFKRMFRAPKGDLLVLLVTFILTIAVELSIAVLVGIVLSCVVFMRRMSGQMQVDDNCDISKDLPDDISVFDVSGPLFFGDTEKFLDAIPVSRQISKVIILRLRNVGLMDSTAMRAINILHDKCQLHDVTLVLSETTDGPYHAMKKLGMVKQLGRENVCREFEEAVKQAKSKI